MITAWRIVQSRWQDTAFSGEGARLYGGRWNSAGTAMVYTSGSLSLAQLEILVHIHTFRLLPEWVVCELQIPDVVVTAVDISELPESWADPEDWSQTQRIGDLWASDGVSAVLRVPSAVSPGEYNFLLNPLHPDFGEIAIGAFRAFAFDARLQRR